MIDQWINSKDKADPDKYRKGRFFVITFLLFFVMCFIGGIFLHFSNTYGIDYIIGNWIMTALILTLLLVYRKWGYRVAIVNIISVMGFGSNQATYDLGGGIFSTDIYSGIIICAWIYLVANKTSGIVWFAITIINITFFYVAELQGAKDFRSMAVKFDSGYYYFNAIFMTLFLFLVIFLYDNSKESFLKMLRTSMADVEQKKLQLEIFKEDTQASINYAKRIQFAVLPSEDAIYRAIPLSFIFYKPKDIVSGDFFWFHEIDRDNYILVCADCTGHGVPGAFMTVIGSSLLNQIVVESRIQSPAAILLELDRRVVHTLKQEKERVENVQDGMDLTVLKVDKKKGEVLFSSAKRPMLFIRNKEMKEYKGSKHSIGGMRTGQKTFEEFRLDVQEDDQLYFYSDGFTDQFGGEKGKKYSSRRFREFVQSIQLQSMQVQSKKMEQEFESWRGSHEQVDDVCVMGIRF